MSRSLAAAEWKDKETNVKHSQAGFPFLAVVQAPVMAEHEFIVRCDDVGAMRYAVQRSGNDDFEVADKLNVSHGYMSKILHGTAGLYGKRLVSFMRVTGSLAPLQWLAHQMGCDVVQRDSRAAEIAALTQRLRELEKAA